MTQTSLPFDLTKASEILSDAAKGADDGDLFVERSRSESFVFDDGRLKSAAFDMLPNCRWTRFAARAKQPRKPSAAIQAISRLDRLQQIVGSTTRLIQPLRQTSP